MLDPLETLDPLAPLDSFTVGPWRVTIRQLVSGPLYWEAVHERTGARAARLPVGFTVQMAREEVEKILTQPAPPLPRDA